MGIGMVEVVEVARLRQLVSMNFEQTCYAFPFLFFFLLTFGLFLSLRFRVQCADEVQR